MKHYVFKMLWMVLLIIYTFSNNLVQAQQLKIGKNIYFLKPNVVLELEDPNQALLLTRVFNPTTAIASPYRGMIVYDSAINKLAYYDGTSWLYPITNVTNAWNLTGNSGTTPGTNFIGTTDDKDVVFKRNNIRAGFLGDNNTAIGVDALTSGTTLGNNTAVGVSALKANTAIGGNTAVGHSALTANTTATGNTAFGSNAAFRNTTGGGNTVVGSNAFFENMTGANNTAVGYYASNKSTGSNNTTLGYQAGNNLTTGSNNIAIGYGVNLPSNTASNQLNIGNSIYGLNMGMATPYMGINTLAPISALHVKGAMRADSLVLTSNKLYKKFNTDYDSIAVVDSVGRVMKVGVKEILNSEIPPATVSDWVLTGYYTLGNGHAWGSLNVNIGGQMAIYGVIADWASSVTSSSGAQMANYMYAKDTISLKMDVYATDNAGAGGGYYLILTEYGDAVGTIVKIDTLTNFLNSGATATAPGILNAAWTNNLVYQSKLQPNTRYIKVSLMVRANRNHKGFKNFSITTPTVTSTELNYVQGGNSFGTLGTLGTKDKYNLSFITNDVPRMTIDTLGSLILNNLLIDTNNYNASLTIDVNGVVKMKTHTTNYNNILQGIKNSGGNAFGDTIRIGSFDNQPMRLYAGNSPGITIKPGTLIRYAPMDSNTIYLRNIAYDGNTKVLLYPRAGIPGATVYESLPTPPGVSFNILDNNRNTYTSLINSQSAGTLCDICEMGFTIPLNNIYYIDSIVLVAPEVKINMANTKPGLDILKIRIKQGSTTNYNQKRGTAGIPPNSPYSISMGGILGDSITLYIDDNPRDHYPSLDLSEVYIYGRRAKAIGASAETRVNGSLALENVANGAITDSLLMIDSVGVVKKINIANIPVNNIYTTDGSLTETRTIHMNEKDLIFDQTEGSIKVNNNAIFDPTAMTLSSTKNFTEFTGIKVSAIASTKAILGEVTNVSFGTSYTYQLAVLGNNYVPVLCNGCFGIFNNSANALSFVITPYQNNMGIGVARPEEKLEVGGTAKANNLMLTNLATGSTSDSLLVISNNNVKKVSVPSITSAWNLTGNASTNPTNNFMGTTDDNDVVFKRNNEQSGLINASLKNTSFGVSALKSNTIGNNNTAIGGEALKSNISGEYSTAIGSEALSFNTIGRDNTAIGYRALAGNTTGFSNTSVGMQALYKNTTGTNNTGIGRGTLLNSDGHNNVAIGYNAGYNHTLGNNNIVIGANTLNLPSNTGSNQLNIGNSIYGLNISSNTVKIGINTSNPQYTLDVAGDINASATVLAAGTALTSDIRLKKNIMSVDSGISKVMQLRPVVYDKKRELPSTNYEYHEIGFIAQEVRKVLPMLVTETKDTTKILSLNYDGIIPILTKAIQEQQKEIENYKQQTIKLTEEVQLLKKLIQERLK